MSNSAPSTAFTVNDVPSSATEPARRDKSGEMFRRRPQTDADSFALGFDRQNFGLAVDMAGRSATAEVRRHRS